MKNECHLIDCMEYMTGCKDGEFDIAIVDPPYGIIDHIICGGESGKKIKQRTELKKWDKQPPAEYWQHLFRISKNQIVFGANYFTQYLPFSRGWIFWDKMIPKGFDRAKGEFIFTSFNRNAEKIKMRWNGNNNKLIKIHSTQKPVALYKWILKNYAQPGWKILDSHVGSGSIRIACHDMGYDFTGCEIDLDYWHGQETRFQNHISQKSIFPEEEMQNLIYQEVNIL